MMALIFLLTTLLVFSDVPQHWNHILEVTDRHEFYQNHETVVKPAEAWQTLFGLSYMDTSLNKIKDCVMFKVPGKEPGVLKLKTIAGSEKCDDYLLQSGDLEVQNIKTLQFSTLPSEVLLDFSTTDFKIHKWEATLPNQSEKKAAMSVSSAEFRSPKIIFLATKSNVSTKPSSFLKDKTLCHDINEDCAEVSASKCTQCENGWYEIPNGCKSGPKYCGTYRCGGKNEHACRRGITWQKLDEEFDCRMNSTFAYCSKGLTVVCEGKKAFCR